MAKEQVVLGSGELYIMEYTGTIPEDVAIEMIENKIGHIKGGASLEYTAEKQEVVDDLGVVIKSFITKENVLFKSGLLSWNGKTLEKLCETATVDETSNLRTVKIGGKTKANGKSYLIHFVHKLDNDKKIRVTLRGTSNNGFTLAFNPEQETVIDAEFKALSSDTEGTLVIYKEDLTA